MYSPYYRAIQKFTMKWYPTMNQQNKIILDKKNIVKSKTQYNENKMYYPNKYKQTITRNFMTQIPPHGPNDDMWYFIVLFGSIYYLTR